MWRRLLRGVGMLVYAFLLLVLFGLSAYISFSLFIRRGDTAAPDLVGLPEAEAVVRATEHGLGLEVDEEVASYDEKIPPGHVLRQDLAAGSPVKEGARIEVVLSLGPQRVEVPDLRGTVPRSAEVTLAGEGLTVGKTVGVFSRGGVAGTVILQDPPPGALTAPLTPVHLFIAQENQSRTFVMPDLVYRDLEAVKGFFDRYGLRLGSVKPEPYEGVAPGVVLRQFPLAGYPLRGQDVVSLVVSAEAG